MRRPVHRRLATLVLLVAALASPRAAAAQQGVDEALAEFVKADPGLQAHLDRAVGYAVFPTVGKAGIGVGGARGKGWVYEAGSLIGESMLTQVTVGLQLGGQVYRELLLFRDQAALDGFRKGNLKLSAQASAVAATAGVSADLPYRDGLAIVTMAKGGLMYEASVGGQKFSFRPLAK